MSMAVIRITEDDNDLAAVLVENALRADPNRWHEVWYPYTDESNYDVARWNTDLGDMGEIELLDEFRKENPIYLESIGARI